MEVLRRLRSRRGALNPPPDFTNRFRMRPLHPLVAACAALCFSTVTACATAQPPTPAPAQPPKPAPATPIQKAADDQWLIKSREHVDLWLHLFAMISDDSAPVPLFRRGYRQAMTVERNRTRVTTDLDANRELLVQRLRANPALVGAQFAALSFGSWAELDAALDLFVQADGSPRAARDQRSAALISFFAGIFPAREDRDFARRLLNALRSERDKFYHEWWLAETRRRNRSLDAVDSLWHKRYLPKLRSYLNHTQQADGAMLLSPALEGEGRTINGDKRQNVIAVGFPETPALAMDAIYAMTHEMVGPLTGAVVDDNTSPADKRSGASGRLSSLAQARGGALLCARISPEFAQGYARFYLRAAGVPADGDVMKAFAKAFPLSQALLDSIERQLDVAFGGI